MITQLISTLVHFSTTPSPPSSADVIDGSPLIAFLPDSDDFWDNEHGRDCLFGMPREVYHNKFFSHFQKRRFHKCLMPDCGKTLDYDQSEMGKHFKRRHETWSLESYYDTYIKKKQVMGREICKFKTGGQFTWPKFSPENLPEFIPKLVPFFKKIVIQKELRNCLINGLKTCLRCS